MACLWSGPPGFNFLYFFCSGIQVYALLSPYFQVYALLSPDLSVLSSG